MSAAVKEALKAFEISTCSPFNGGGIDAVNEILPMIFSIATLLEMGHRKDLKGDCAFEAVNSELVACAFDGIAHLAALAMFQLEAE